MSTPSAHDYTASPNLRKREQRGLTRRLCLHDSSSSSPTSLALSTCSNPTVNGLSGSKLMPTSPPVLARCLPNRFTHASRTCITPHYVPSSSAAMTLTAMPPTRARAYHINIGIDGIAHHSPVVTQNKPVHRCTTAALPPPMPSMPVLSCTAARKYPALDSPRAFVHTVPAVCPLSPPLTLHRVHQRLYAVSVGCAVRQLPAVINIAPWSLTPLLISPGSPLQRPARRRS